MRKRRRVVLHLESRTPGVDGVTLEGFLVRAHLAGHYGLAMPKLIRGVDDTLTIDAAQVAIPRERVLFCEVHP